MPYNESRYEKLQQDITPWNNYFVGVCWFAAVLVGVVYALISLWATLVWPFYLTALIFNPASDPLYKLLLVAIPVYVFQAAFIGYTWIYMARLTLVKVHNLLSEKSDKFESYIENKWKWLQAKW